ncbi:hypothetical protein CTI12_AA080990 [Artemisia annua]|uniref:Uncharacterized protein n=1 Tax=Artemisia annua TaxID=35608 RepID=A0A2U1Q2S8_ARTAN|nr:hypothetical protein CTI12_AA080990 [Artemisia annua]
MEEMKTPCNSVYEGIPPLSADYAWLIGQNLEGDNLTMTRMSRVFTLYMTDHHIVGVQSSVGSLSWSGDVSEDHKRKKSRWIEMSYAKKLKNLTDEDDILDLLTWCNDKVYAMGASTDYIIPIDIVVKEKEVVISLLPLPEFPFLTTMDTLDVVYLFKLDMTSKTSTWEEIDDLKDAIFFVNIYDWSICYYPAIASELGGYDLECLVVKKVSLKVLFEDVSIAILVLCELLSSVGQAAC